MPCYWSKAQCIGGKCVNFSKSIINQTIFWSACNLVLSTYFFIYLTFKLTIIVANRVHFQKTQPLFLTIHLIDMSQGGVFGKMQLSLLYTHSDTGGKNAHPPSHTS